MKTFNHNPNCLSLSLPEVFCLDLCNYVIYEFLSFHFYDSFNKFNKYFKIALKKYVASCLIFFLDILSTFSNFFFHFF